MEGRRLIVWALVVAVCVVAGCLDFDEETIYVEHDRENDRLLLIIDYGGLYAGRDLEKSKAQLAEAIESGTVAFVENWPWAFPVREMREDLASPDFEEDIPEDVRQKLLVFLGRVEVFSGGFYRDPGGRLCGAQVVVFENVSDTMKLANELVSDGVILASEDWSEETLAGETTEAACLAAAREGHTWIELKGHSLIAAIPMPEGAFWDARSEMDRAVRSVDREDEVAELLRWLRALVASPVYIWHEDDVLKVKVGLQSVPSTLVVKPREGEYEPNLVEHVEETYGLRLDANLARYLTEPEAPAETEAERAALLMVPRLTKLERVRALVHAQGAEPAAPYLEALRRELLCTLVDPRPPDEIPDDELLTIWREWLGETVDKAD